LVIETSLHYDARSEKHQKSINVHLSTCKVLVIVVRF